MSLSMSVSQLLLHKGEEKINKQNYFFSNCETNQTDFNIRNKKTLCILVATTFSGSGNFRDLFWWDL